MWDYLFYKIIFLTFSSSIAGIMVMLFTKIFSRRLTKTQCYYLWLIPLILAVIPVMGINLRSQSDMVHNTVTPRQVADQQNTTVSPKNVSQTITTTITTNMTPNMIPVTIPVTKKPIKYHISYTQIICILWLLGVVTGAIYNVISLIRFRRKMPYILSDADEDMNVVMKQCTEYYKGSILLKTIAADISPFVTGLFHPTIVIPDTVQIHELRPILFHEITHLKRKDLIYLLLLQFVITLHFFNPLIYVFAREIKKLMELSCDETVSKMLTVPERKVYGMTILSMMKFNCKNPQNSLCLSEDARNIKERLEVIMRNKVHTKLTQIISAILTMTILLGTTAFAAAVNEQNPVKSSYVVNKLSDIGYFSYSNRNDKEDSYAGAGKGTRDIVLVNSPFYKTFYAKVEIPEYSKDLNNGVAYIAYDQNGNKMENDKKVKQNVSAEIRMNAIEKVLNDGNDWVGRFTVSIDGHIVADNVTGYISNIPSNRKSAEYPSFYIYNEQTAQNINLEISLECMNFNLEGEDMIAHRYRQESAKQALKEDANTKVRYVKELRKAYYDGVEMKPDNTNLPWASTIMYNPTMSKSDFSVLTRIEGKTERHIHTNYTENYKCTDDSITGKFYISIFNSICDEFYGTVTGLSGKTGDTVKIVSDDGRYQLEFSTSDYEDSFDYMNTNNRRTYTVPESFATSADPQEKQQYENSKFVNSSDQEHHEIVTSMLPFTFTLNQDRKGVTVKLKEGIAYDGWCSVMATYNNNPEDLWTIKTSKDGDREWVYPVLSDTTTHLIQFNAYNQQPYIHMDQFNMYFKIIDGKLLFTECQLESFENKSYSGDTAKELLYNTVYPEKTIFRQ